MARLLVAKSKWEIIAFKYKEMSLAMTTANSVIDKYWGRQSHSGGVTPVVHRTNEPPIHLATTPHCQSQSPPDKVGRADGL